MAGIPPLLIYTFYIILYTLPSGETCRSTEGGGSSGVVARLDRTEVTLKLGDVVCHGLQEALCVKRGHDHAAAYLCFGHTWHHLQKVYNELRIGVRNHGKIRVYTGGYLGWNFYVKLGVLGLFFVIHKSKLHAPGYTSQANLNLPPLPTIFASPFSNLFVLLKDLPPSTSQ